MLRTARTEGMYTGNWGSHRDIHLKIDFEILSRIDQYNKISEQTK